MSATFRFFRWLWFHSYLPISIPIKQCSEPLLIDDFFNGCTTTYNNNQAKLGMIINPWAIRYQELYWDLRAFRQAGWQGGSVSSFCSGESLFRRWFHRLVITCPNALRPKVPKVLGKISFLSLEVLGPADSDRCSSFLHISSPWRNSQKHLYRYSQVKEVFEQMEAAILCTPKTATAFGRWQFDHPNSFVSKYQGLVTVPFWVYWTSPYSSHYRPYT